MEFRGENTIIKSNYINECCKHTNVGGCIVIALGGTESRLDNITIENNTILQLKLVL